MQTDDRKPFILIPQQIWNSISDKTRQRLIEKYGITDLDNIPYNRTDFNYELYILGRLELENKNEIITK